MAITIKESQHLSIPFEDIEVATNNFTTVIGKGGYGFVYKGKLLLSNKLTIVAVKRLSSNISGQGFKEFLTEIKLLSRYKHPNLISLLGFCEEGNEKILIYEHAVRGSLDKYLRSDDKAPASPLTWTQRINICIDAAQGLDYLHNHVGKFHKIIHRDIKSANILLDQSWKAMISDLGLSKIGRSNDNDSYLITNACGTHGYCDPVYRDTGILTKESDVYSFGVVLFEVLCGRLCFMNVQNERRFLDRLALRYYEAGRLNEIVDIELKDQIGSTSLNIIADIAYQCLQNDREKRPSMSVVVEKLEEARKSQIMSGPAIGVNLGTTNSCVGVWQHDANDQGNRTTPFNVAECIESNLRKLNSASPDDQRAAAGEIRLLAKRNADNRVAISEAGAIPLLTHLLTAPDSLTQEHAVTALLNLSIREDNKGSIVSSGALPGLVQVLRTGSMVARENAAATLFSLSVIDEYKVAIGNLEAIPPLVLLLKEGTQRGKKDAVTALFNLCIYQGNKGRAVRAGLVPTLMQLTEPESVMKGEALAILAILSSHPEGKLAIGDQAEVVLVLVELIGNGSPRNKENAAAILANLCSADQKYLVEAQEIGVMGVLADLLHHGTDRGKRLAKQLLEKMQR